MNNIRPSTEAEKLNFSDFIRITGFNENSDTFEYVLISMYYNYVDTYTMPALMLFRMTSWDCESPHDCIGKTHTL